MKSINNLLEKQTRLIGFLILLLALVLRLVAAQKAYPTPGDASHFVQHGVALAHGVPGAMSTYWSQGMILLAAAAVKLGIDPKIMLQSASVISGVYVVLGGMLILFRLGAPSGAAWIYGLLSAVNSALIHYSATGYSEMTYMAFLVGAVHVGLIANHRKLSDAWWLWTISGLLFGMGGYFKGLDAVVALCSFCLYQLLAWPVSWTDRIARCSILVIIAFVTLLPLCIYTYQTDGKFAPGNKGGNLFLGLDWQDSKKVYNPRVSIQDKSFIDVVEELPSRLVQNSLNTVRLLNESMFIKGLRVGTIWYALFFTFISYHAVRYRFNEARLLCILFSLQILLLCLVFVHARILTPSLPWLLMLFGLGLFDLWSKSIMPTSRVLVITCLTYIGAMSIYAHSTFTREYFYWRYENIVETANRLKSIAAESDRIMTYGGTLASEFYKVNPLQSFEIPFGPLSVVEAKAEQKKIDFILVSDQYHGHWPISDVFNGDEPLPFNWTVEKVLVFDQNSYVPEIIERVCVIRRQNSL